MNNVKTLNGIKTRRIISLYNQNVHNIDMNQFKSVVDATGMWIIQKYLVRR